MPSRSPWRTRPATRFARSTAPPRPALTGWRGICVMTRRCGPIGRVGPAAAVERVKVRPKLRPKSPAKPGRRAVLAARVVRVLPVRRAVLVVPRARALAVAAVAEEGSDLAVDA